MLWLTWQIWFLLLLAFAGGLITGWVARAQPDEVPEDDKADRDDKAPIQGVSALNVEDEPVKKGASAEPSRPSAPAEPEPAPEQTPPPPPAENDDLTRIKGLGPRAAEKLHEAGIHSFSQIAGWSESDVEKFDALINGRGRIERDNWVEQARELTAS